MLQADPQKAEFFCRQTFAIREAYQPILSRNLDLYGLELAEDFQVLVTQ
jgi:hypothetical protein